ncbi:MAG: ABC transporter permease [Pontibacterium sp.]
MIVALAWRNLWRYKRRTFLSAIAIAATCALTIFLPSLQAGSYQAMVSASLGVLDGYLQIQHPEYLDKPAMRNSFVPPASVVRALEAGNVTTAARASGFALLTSPERSVGVQVVGVEPEKEVSVSTVPGNIVTGRYLQQNNEIVLGSALARNLRQQIGDQVTLLGTGRDGSLAVDSLKVVGFFETGFPALDRQLAEINLSRFNTTFSMEGQRHGLILQSASEINRADLQPLIESEGLAFRDWKQLQPGLLHAIKLDISSAVMMYVILILVICFSLMNAMLMSVLERSREFGMVMALGVRPMILGRILWLENLMITLLGIMAGLVIGAVVTLYYQSAGIHFSGAEEVFARYGLSSTIYPELSALTLLSGPVIIAVVLVIAGFYPVWRVSRLNLLDAMRAI